MQQAIDRSKGNLVRSLTSKADLTKQKCAMKVVSDDPDVKAEIAAIHAICKAGFPNPHIIRVYGILFRDDDVLCTRHTFIHMEFCNGTLESYLDDMRSRHASIEPLEIAEIMIQILTGLGHCHTLGFCHRDLKLPNSMFS